MKFSSESFNLIELRHHIIEFNLVNIIIIKKKERKKWNKFVCWLAGHWDFALDGMPAPRTSSFLSASAPDISSDVYSYVLLSGCAYVGVRWNAGKSLTIPAAVASSGSGPRRTPVRCLSFPFFENLTKFVSFSTDKHQQLRSATFTSFLECYLGNLTFIIIHKG